jgi:capsular exopolysaccharide synthesis family protein
VSRIAPGIRPADYIIEKPLGSYSEAVRGLQIGLIQANVDERPKVVLITSSVPDEGKTTVALSMARLAARAGSKVVLVDADLRRPAVSKSLGLEKVENGLVEVLSNQIPLAGALREDPMSSLLVLPANKTAASPPDLLASAAMERLIGELRDVFDLVIIDTAPILPVNDTRVLTRMANAVVFIVRWDKTPRDAVVNAARILTDSCTRVAGVALTRADPARYRYYSYGYQNYYSYEKYYGK